MGSRGSGRFGGDLCRVTFFFSIKKGEFADAKRFLDVYSRNARQSARSLWLGIRIERIFGNKDKEASYALALKNLHPYSREYLEYKNLIESEK